MNFRVFYDHTTPECDHRGQMRLSKSDKNIGAGGWLVDNLFEAAYLGDVLAHPRITTTHTETERERERERPRERGVKGDTLLFRLQVSVNNA